MIRNTTADMNDDANRLLFLAESMTSSPGDAIEAMEARGQRELVHSDRLPTDTNDTDAEFLALGFTFGEPDPSDPMFRPATLPDGWKREGSDHAMWSYIADDLGRRRVAIFYKAAFYDRSAFMRVNTVHTYVYEQVFDGRPVVTDPVWATPDRIVEACHERIARIDEGVKYCTTDDDKRQATERRARYVALIEQHTA